VGEGTLLERLKKMGISEAGETRLKPGDSKTRSMFHTICPLDIQTRGLIVCTNCPSISVFLSARPGTLARHCKPEEVFFGDKGIPTALTPQNIASSATSITTRVYRARLGRKQLLPYTLDSLSRGDSPIFINGVPSPEPRDGAPSTVSEEKYPVEDESSSEGTPPKRAKLKRTTGSSNLWVTVVTSLDSKPLRIALGAKKITISNLQRVQQGPFLLKGVIKEGSVMEVNVPTWLENAAKSFSRRLKEQNSNVQN